MGQIYVQRTCRFWIDDEDILRGVLEAPDFTLEDAIAMMELHRKIIDGRARRFLMNISKLKALPREVRAYFGKPEHVEVHKALALVTGSPLSRAIGNFFLGLNRPAMPIRLVPDDERGLEWLRTQAP